MSQVLKVIKPFFVMEEGDTFEYDSKANVYVSSYSATHNEESDSSDKISSSYTSEYKISPDYAQALISDGYLLELSDKSQNFINVFDEINQLLVDYSKELSDIDEDMSEMPACMKVEKQTVLTNMITLLKHLNSLKK